MKSACANQSQKLLDNGKSEIALGFWLRGQDLHLRLEVMGLSYCPTLLPRHNKKWSGWQELNLRGHVPKTCGWPLPYTRIVGEGLFSPPLF